MSASDEIKSSLTLDVTKFTSALDKVESGLDTLDKNLQTVAKATDTLEKGVGSVASELASTTGKIKLLDETLARLVSRLDAGLSKGVASVGEKTRRTKKDLDDLSAGAKGASETVLGISNTLKRYAESAAAVNPLISGLIKSNRELAAETEKAANATAATREKALKAQIDTLNKERTINAEAIAERKKAIRELERIERGLGLSKQDAAREARQLFIDNPVGAKQARDQANQLGVSRQQARDLIDHIGAIVKELEWKNNETVKGIGLVEKELKAVKELQAARLADAQAQAQAEAELKRATNARIEREKQAAKDQAEALAGKMAAQKVVDHFKFDGKDYAKWWTKALKERERDEREASEKIKKIIAEETAYKKAQAEQAAAIKQFNRQANEAAASVKRGDYINWWKEELKQQEDAAAKALAAKKQADAAAAESAKNAARAREQAAIEAARVEMAEARRVTDMWKGMGAMWAASKITSGLGAGLQKASESQQTELRVKLLNLPTDEFEEFKKKAFETAREEKYISTVDALQARLDALTSIGHNDTRIIDATMTSALRNAEVMMSSGYEHGSRSDLIKNLYGFAESRQVMNDPEKVKESFDIARRMGVASNGKINIADLETVARNMGDLRQSMSKEGWMGVAALMEQFKVAGGHGGGAGAGVSSVGTMLKMMSLYAAGKPVTNTAALQLLGADVMNDVFADGSAQNFKEGAQNNATFARMVKSAGFKGVKEMSASPVDFFSGLREQTVAYTKAPENKSKFYEGSDKEKGDVRKLMSDSGMEVNEDEVAESAALKRFFSKMGMSNKTVDGMLVMMNKGFIERSHHVRELAKNADDEDKAMEKVRGTWANAVAEMKAGAVSLAASFEPVLVPLAKIPSAIGSIMAKAAEFVRNNPIMGAIDLAGVALAGLTLTVKGVIGSFGPLSKIAGDVATYFGKTVIATGEMGAASGLLTKALNVLKAPFEWLGSQAVRLITPLSSGFVGVAESVAAFGARVIAAIPGVGTVIGWLGTKFASMFAGVMAGAAGLGGWLGSFLARIAAPGFGWLTLAGQIGWVIGSWIKDWDIGGLTLSERVQNTFLDIEMGIRNGITRMKGAWVDFKKMLGGSDYLGEAADRAELKAEEDANKKYEERMRIKPRKPKEEKKEDKPKDAEKKHDDKSTPKVNTEGANRAAGVFGGGGKKQRAQREPRIMENTWANQFQAEAARTAIEDLKLEALMSGKSTFEEQARQKFVKMWSSGQLDDGKDPSKRRFVKGAKRDKNGRILGYDAQEGLNPDQIDWNEQASIGGGKTRSPAQWVDQEAKRLRTEAELKAVAYAAERAAAAEEDLKNAQLKSAQATDRRTDSLVALDREFIRMEERTPSAKSNAAVQLGRATALGNRAGADFVSEAASLKLKNEELQISLLDTEGDRLRASLEHQRKTEDERQAIIRESLTRQIRELDAQLEKWKGTEEEKTKAYKDALAARARLAKLSAEQLAEFEKNKSLRTEVNNKELESPAQKTLKSWRDTEKQVKELQNSMLTGFADRMAALVSGNKPNWREFFAGYFKEVANVAAKNSISMLFGGKDGKGGLGGEAGVSGILGGLWGGDKIHSGGIVGDWLNSMRSDKNGDIKGSGIKGYVEGAGSWVEKQFSGGGDNEKTEGGMLSTVFSSLAEKGKTLGASIGNLGSSVMQSAASLWEFASTAVVNGIKSLFGMSLATDANSTATVASATSAASAAVSLEALSIAAFQAATANEYEATTSYFANGGIMTNSGSLPLNYYARGGIANSPQIAVFGEAGAEAYVPLPDGRAIPVNMRIEGATANAGSGGQVVNIGITVNANGGESKTESGDGDTQKMSELANRIKLVVREEINNQSRPGGLLYK